MSTTRKDTPTRSMARAAAKGKARTIARAMGRDAAGVLYETYCHRRDEGGYGPADRRLDGADQYGRALAALQREHGLSDDKINRLDEAHGRALALVDEQAFYGGLAVGLALAGGVR